MAARSMPARTKAATNQPLRWLAWGLDYLALAALITTIFLIGYWYSLNALLFPSSAPSAGHYPLIALDASDISMPAAVALWLIARIFAAITRQARAPLRFGPAYLILPLFSLSLLSALSATQAIVPPISLEIAMHLFLLTLFMVAVINLRPPIWAVIAPLALLLVIEGAVSLLQVQAQSTLFAPFLFGWKANATASQPGAVVVQLSNGARWLRGYGTFPHPNILGGFLCLTVPLVAGGYRCLPWRSLRAWVMLAALALGLLALLLSFSRAAWLGMLAGALWASWLFWLRRRAARRASAPDTPAIRQHNGWHSKTGRAWMRPALLGLLGVGVMVSLVATFGPVLQSRLLLDKAALEQRSVDERLALLQASALFLSKYPWLGVGAGNMPFVELSYPPTSAIQQPVHNVPLLVGVETGIFGLLLWLVGPLCILWAAWRRRFQLSTIGLAASAAIVALLVSAQLDHYLWSSTTGRLMFWLALTLAALWCQQDQFKTKSTE